MRRCLQAALASVLLCSSLPALAAYKCESNGKISYSDVPCPEGKQTAVNANPAIDEQAAARARQDAKREKAELTQLEKERHKREAAEEKQARTTARQNAAKESKCATLAQRAKWRDEDAASATGRSIEKAKRRARHAHEAYDLQCKT